MRGSDALRAWRGDRSQGECATLLGVSQATVSDWESGKKRPDVDQAVQLERASEGAIPVALWVRSEAERAALRRARTRRGRRRRVA